MKVLSLLVWCLVVQFNAAHAQSVGSVRVDLESGESVRISEMTRSGPLIITFWALWCKPCLAEMKTFPSLINRFSGDSLTVLAINQDSPKSLAKVKSYLKANSLDVRLVLDPENELLDRFNGNAIPLTLLVDREGTIVYRQTGYYPGDETKLEAAVEMLLKGSQP